MPPDDDRAIGMIIEHKEQCNERMNEIRKMLRTLSSDIKAVADRFEGDISELHRRLDSVIAQREKDKDQARTRAITVAVSIGLPAAGLLLALTGWAFRQLYLLQTGV
jgi:hypothetical protein